MSLSKQELSDYQVCHVIGSGSFGTCYKVRHKHTNKFYVWKVIDYGDMSEEKKKLLVSEVNVLSELDSRYIVKYHNRIIDPDITTLYIIMEYCPGGDLASLIKRCKRTEQYLEEKFIWKVLYQLSIAIHVCHSSLDRCQVLHRDIKPANVFLDENNNVKLGDFGLARVLDWDESHSNTIVGTPYYMSPEVIKGGKYNLKSDIWALGCLIYELCSFKPPFHGDNIRQLSQQIMDNGFQRIPAHYSDDLHHIVHYLLSKNNAVRPSIETLLQNPLVLKYTLPYSDSSDPVYSVPKDIKNTHIQTPSAIASKETIQNENTDLSTHLNRSDNSPIPLVPPTTNISSRIYQNVFVKNKIEVYEDNKTKQNESYDEIYGTCVDNDSTAGNVSLKEHSNSNYEKFPPKCELHLCSAVPSCEHTSNMSATSSTQVCCSITAESSKESTELLNEFSSEQKNQMLDDTGIKKRENEQQTELFDNQMRLMRQIFNSKMHLKDILQCCSSDENIYMNSKSLLGRNLASSDKNNNQQGHLENTTKLITMNDNVSIENLDRCVLKPYLETAIDGSFRNNVHVKDDAFIPDENANNAIQENIEIFQDQHDIMARYQTLEDKINQILSIQNKNHQIKSTHGDELEFLLKVRLDRIRQHETYIKHKEKQLQSLEQSLNRREKSLALQEKMVQQKIQRAQVYLKQCKESRKSSGAKTRSVSELKDNMKQLHIDPVVRDEKEVSARNPLPLNSKLSKFNLPARKTDIHTKEVPIPQFKKLLPVDNDSSFSADPGDTSILPTMSKIDPDKVKPLKYYRHVHFEDQFTELFNDIDLNINKISNTATNSNIKNQLQTIHTRTEENSCNNNIEFTKCNRHTESVKHQSNQENIPTKLTSDALRAVRVSNTQGHSQDRNKQITKAGQSTFMVNNSIKVHDNTFHGHKTKQLCHSNHMINQRQSLVNMKLRQFVEQRQPLSNIQASDKTMTKRHSSPSGLVGPGFITSTLTNKVMHKDEQVKSAKLKTLLPSGEVNIQSSKNGDQKTNVQQESKLTGMRKHFVKSKTSQSSSNIQQCIRRSMRSKEAHNSKPSVYHNMGDGKENKPQGISKESRLSESSLQSFNLDLKQLNQHNIGLIRKQLKPLSLQNHPIKQKSNFRDVLKTRYDHLELSPLPSEVTL